MLDGVGVCVLALLVSMLVDVGGLACIIGVKSSLNPVLHSHHDHTFQSLLTN